LLANKGAVVGIGVPALTLEVIDAAREIEPHNGVLWAMFLSLLLVLKKRQGWRRISRARRIAGYGLGLAAERE
jgi:hypothetical protein